MEGLTQRSAIRGPLPWVAAAIAALITAVGTAFVVGMRTKSPLVQKAVRRLNRAFWNPKAMETAGTPGAYASIIHHVGRRSGTAYHTPVVPIRIDDGFAVALPYGEQADWVQNVLAAGRATLTYEGVTYEVAQPEVAPIDTVDRYFDKSDRAAHRMFNVDRCLRLGTVHAVAADSTDTPTGRLHAATL